MNTGRMNLGLAIDTTFDDTSVAVLRGHRTLLSNLTISQFENHADFGGVVPERASRKHLEVIHPLVRRAMDDAGATFDELDWIAVSNLPGLMGAVLVGLTVAKAMSFALGASLVAVNHIESHPYACLLDRDDFDFPVIHLVIAGGHTLLIHQTEHFQWSIVGRTRDDAAGECADKVARMYGLPMPGGKYVDALAASAQPGAYAFPRPMLREKSFDFSFSGLKTALLRQKEKDGIPENLGPLMAAFLGSIKEVLVHKTLRAAEEFDARMITVSGGLAASSVLRQAFTAAAAKAGIPLALPSPAFCTDNAAMVAVLAARMHAAGQTASPDVSAFPNLLS